MLVLKLCHNAFAVHVAMRFLISAASIEATLGESQKHLNSQPSYVQVHGNAFWKPGPNRHHIALSTESIVGTREIKLERHCDP